MLFTPWYSFSSILGEKTDNRHYDDLCCKHKEFFYLWYLYQTKFLSRKEKIYIVDCASPIPIDEVLAQIGEPFQIIEDPQCYDLDPSANIYVKRYKKELNHFYGSSRTHVDYLKCCYHNNLDFNIIESDVLIGYDFFADCKDKDFCTQRIRDNGMDTIFQGAICFVDKDNIRTRFEDGSMKRYLDHDINDLDFHEGEMYRLFCRGRISELSSSNYVHKVKTDELRRFMIDNPINHPYYHFYLEKL